MIPDQPTDENIKPILAMMVPSIVYNMIPHQTANRVDKFQWADDILKELLAAKPKGKVSVCDIPGGKGTVICIINDTTGVHS